MASEKLNFRFKWRSHLTGSPRGLWWAVTRVKKPWRLVLVISGILSQATIQLGTGHTLSIGKRDLAQLADNDVMERAVRAVTSQCLDGLHQLSAGGKDESDRVLVSGLTK